MNFVAEFIIMKTLSICLILFFAGIIVLPGCSKSGTLSNGMAASVQGGSSNNNTFSASGTSVTATEKTVTAAGISTINLVVTGTSLSGSIITLTINGFNDSLAVFGINSFQVIASYTPGTGQKSVGSVSGTGAITITAISPYIQGSFGYACTDGTEVSNGTFTVKAP